MRLRVAWLALGLLLWSVGTVDAQQPQSALPEDDHSQGSEESLFRGLQAPSEPTGYHALENTDALFLGMELGASTLIGVVPFVADEPATQCGWCTTNGFDRRVRRALVWDDRVTAGTLSHVLSLGLVPAIALTGLLVPALTSHNGSFALQDSLILLSTFGVVTGIVEGIKRSSDRQRPGFHYGLQDETEARKFPGQQFLSFCSGDTAWAFGLAAGGATLAFLRGYESAPYIAIGGGTVALVAGVLRIAADMHWATDVLTGAGVGTALGILVPTLLHARTNLAGAQVAVAPTIGSGNYGMGATLQW